MFFEESIFGHFEFHMLSLLGDIFLFCKGADSSIFPRVKEGKIDQVRSRVERNAVVRFRFIDLFTWYQYQKEIKCSDLLLYLLTDLSLQTPRLFYAKVRSGFVGSSLCNSLIFICHASRLVNVSCGAIWMH